MQAASRVLLVPPGPWDEEQLLAAARGLAAKELPVRPGDEMGGLIVVGVEPAPGAALNDATELEIRPTPRRGDAKHVDLAILLDASESMGEPWSVQHTRYEAAAEALTAFLRNPGSYVADISLFTYAKEPQLVAGPATAAHMTVPVVKPKGRSSTGAALNAALAHLAASARDDRCQSILMLTDGAGEVTELLHAAERAGRLVAPVHVLVFAPEIDEVFGEVARASAGTVQKATLPLTIEFVHEGSA